MCVIYRSAPLNCSVVIDKVFNDQPNGATSSWLYGVVCMVIAIGAEGEGRAAEQSRTNEPSADARVVRESGYWA